jgi:hypothetical protein
LCDLLGDGEGLGVLLRERDGDGLGERDLDGLGLLLEDGFGLFVLLGLDDPVGLCDGLRLGLGLVVGLGLLVGLALLLVLASWLAETAETELRPHGDAAGLAVEANAGAIAKPDERNDPATTQMATRPARLLASSTGALRSSAQPSPAHAVAVVPYQPT